MTPNLFADFCLCGMAALAGIAGIFPGRGLERTRRRETLLLCAFALLGAGKLALVVDQGASARLTMMVVAIWVFAVRAFVESRSSRRDPIDQPA